MVRPRVFFDFSLNGGPIGRVIFELFSDTAPRTCENFRALCTGEKGLSPSGNPLYYKNSIIHRSIKDFMIQGGDFTKRNGSGGESIFGGMFADEDLTRPLDSEALLCMANKGPNTNGSQFFITLRPCPHLNGKHVVFGRVIRGYAEIVERIAEVPVDEKDRPTVPVVISNSGELELRKPVQPAGRDQVIDKESSEAKLPKSKHRKRSASVESDHAERKHKSKKHRKQRSPARSSSPPASITQAPAREETEEEYDARLEREEKERIEQAKLKELERLKHRYEADSNSGTNKNNGVRFKGRGMMKYVDPELSNRRHS
ncbi:hypothetical protein AX16_004975 [Volvariella volvacea WC 439]|nr:hypothetical protein AX16_004975 [Volvariella volvacea WC 439]